MLYGLKQALDKWNSKIDKYFIDHGFSRSPSEPSLYVKMHGDGFLILYFYLDDLVYTSTDVRIIKDFKKTMI